MRGLASESVRASVPSAGNLRGILTFCSSFFPMQPKRYSSSGQPGRGRSRGLSELTPPGTAGHSRVRLVPCALGTASTRIRRLSSGCQCRNGAQGTPGTWTVFHNVVTPGTSRTGIPCPAYLSGCNWLVSLAKHWGTGRALLYPLYPLNRGSKANSRCSRAGRTRRAYPGNEKDD